MRVFLRVVVLPALLALAHAFPKPASHVVHEKRDITHPRWVKRSGIYGRANLPMRIGLTQSNLDRGFEYMMDVYVSQYSSKNPSFVA